MANDEGTRFLFNSEEAIQAMEFTQSLVLEHRVARQGTGYPDFWAGKLGMTERSTASLQNNINNSIESGFRMGVGPLACNVQCYAPIGGGNLHMFNAGTEAQKSNLEADELPPAARQPGPVRRRRGYMAGRRSSLQSHYLQDKFKEEPRFITTYLQLEVAQPRVKVPIWPEFLTEIGKFGTRQHRDGANVRQELNELVRIGNQMLDEWYATHSARLQLFQ